MAAEASWTVGEARRARVGRRIVIGTVGALALALVVCLVVAGWCWLAIGMGMCDGDGGFPTVARASLAGRFCSSSGRSVYAGAQLLVPLGLVLGAAVAAVVRARWRDLVVGVIASLVAAVAMLLVVAVLPGDCSAAQARRLGAPSCQRY